MKNILLVGNGFDLYYKLPTKYADFLHVVKFLLKNRNNSNSYQVSTSIENYTKLPLRLQDTSAACSR